MEAPATWSANRTCHDLRTDDGSRPRSRPKFGVECAEMQDGDNAAVVLAAEPVTVFPARGSASCSPSRSRRSGEKADTFPKGYVRSSGVGARL